MEDLLPCDRVKLLHLRNAFEHHFGNFSRVKKVSEGNF